MSVVSDFLNPWISVHEILCTEEEQSSSSPEDLPDRIKPGSAIL